MTVRFKNELVRNITIKLGYANAKVRRAALCSFYKLTLPWTRSTNAKTLPAQDLAATGHIDQTKKTTLRANVRDVEVA